MNKKVFAIAAALVLLTLWDFRVGVRTERFSSLQQQNHRGQLRIHHRRQQIGRTRPHRSNDGRGDDSV